MKVSSSAHDSDSACGVGIGFLMYPQRFGANAEGIMSLGG
jgi:hypothetical protein